MNKEQLLDDPSRSDSCKICLIAPFLRSYPDVVVIVCKREYKVSLKHSEQLRKGYRKYDNNMRHHSPLRLTDHHNC